MLYLSYVQSWYKDVVNFKDRHTKQWDDLPSDAARGLFAHLDTLAYVEQLERLLAEHSIDVAGLQSSRQFNMIGLTI